MLLKIPALTLLFSAVLFSQSSSIPAASGGGGSGAPTDAQYLTLTTNGTLSAERVLTPGTGLSGSDAGAGLAYTLSTDTAVLLSRATAQAGTTLYCRSTTGNDTYTCSLTPTLTAYTRGGCVVLDGDTANTGTATLNVNSLGAKSILNRAGSALADGDITANKPITLCYDGTQYIIQGDGGGGGGGIADPGSNGILARTSLNTTAARTITVTANRGLSVTNGSGASGNPEITQDPISGPWMPFGGFNNLLINASTLGAANRVKYAAVTLETPRTFSRVGTYTGSAHSGSLAIAIYDSSCNLVAQSDTLTGASTNTGYFMNISATLAPGKYFIAYTGDNTSAQMYYGQSYPAYTQGIANASPNNTSSTYQAFYGSNNSTGTSTLTFPSSCGTRTALATALPEIPVLYFE